ncbi:hypothetical protein K491DRAFT_774352 [Lophiostoma macrostomum CBS 122681]|uniref:Uncharacterized protein n=1 Tax=Lophiostoma macrostomum CBS 122681 TaxID=1314788 RepID=A0A6A6TP16_9PLEO|nr:hypothetical protein K491DRAFT_774352 [Lophiostoma macrostomum CBS 122681]
MRTPAHLRKPDHVREHIGAPPPKDLWKYTHPTCRTALYPESISIWAWPSPGGLIVLEHATALDFEAVGLDRINLQLFRDEDQDREDELARRLLLLGARWFGSEERYHFIQYVAEDDEKAITQIETNEEPPTTALERRWVSVAWANGTNVNDGLWVLEFEIMMYGWQERHNHVPGDVGKVSLAKTMEEKCQILRSMGAKFYSTLAAYDGVACLHMWEVKTRGMMDVGQQTSEENP